VSDPALYDFIQAPDTKSKAEKEIRKPYDFIQAPDTKSKAEKKKKKP
jgi:hypothetical protein